MPRKGVNHERINISLTKGLAAQVRRAMRRRNLRNFSKLVGQLLTHWKDTPDPE